jgi:ferredoxin
MTNFETYLSNFTEADWLIAIEELRPCIHEVDQDATDIWFRFYPLSLKRFIDAAEDREATLHGLAMLGDFELKDQIDTSHHFLFGHRYWNAVKCSIEKEAEEFKNETPTLTDIVKNVAMRVSKKLKIDRQLVNGIVAVGLMTLNQVGLDGFKNSPGAADLPKDILKKSPEQIIEDRQKDDSQGMFGFLKTVDKKYSVRYAAQDYAGKFPVMNDQEVTQASALDRSKNWQSLDERCWEGPVPVECTSASCGTCWVGVLGGREKLNEVGRRERRAMKVFGYNQPEGDHPALRLACQTRATGNVTLVIPPWNAVFGKKVYNNLEELELEPVTTSAKQLRETVKEAVNGK